MMRQGHIATSGFHAVIVDHGLRPEAASEATKTKAALAEWGIDSTIIALGMGAQQQDAGCPRHGSSARRHRGTTITQARDARAEAIATFALARGYERVFLGHQRDDQAETLLMRATRSSSWFGLRGMGAVTSTWWGGQEVRPLLGWSRAELRDWLRQQQPRVDHWIEDPSNSDRRQLRVRWRQLLSRDASSWDSGAPGTSVAQGAPRGSGYAAEGKTAAANAAYGDGTQERLIALAKHNQRRWSVYRQSLAAAWGQAVVIDPIFGTARMRLAQWYGMATATQRWMVYGLIRHAGNRQRPPTRAQVDRVVDLLNAWRDTPKGRSLTVAGVWWLARGDTVLALRDYGSVRPALLLPASFAGDTDGYADVAVLPAPKPASCSLSPPQPTPGQRAGHYGRFHGIFDRRWHCNITLKEGASPTSEASASEASTSEAPASKGSRLLVTTQGSYAARHHGDYPLMRDAEECVRRSLPKFALVAEQSSPAGGGDAKRESCHTVVSDAIALIHLRPLLSASLPVF